MQLPSPSPVKILKEINAKYGSVLWGRVNEALRMKQSGKMIWPDWCFIPMAGWSAMIHGNDPITDISQTFKTALIAAVGAWRYTQGIYRFSPELHKAIEETPLDGNLPSDVILRLPEYSVYVELPNSTVQGFFAHLEYCTKAQRQELRFWIDDKRDGYPFVLHIGEWSIEEAINKALGVALDNCPPEQQQFAKSIIDEGMKETIRLFSYFVSLLLYLSSDEPDIDRVEQELPKRPQLQRTKKGLALEPPLKPRIWNVGNSIATALKLWAKEPTGAEHNSPRPHIRRAHWHGFWKGERNSQERVFFYKWLPPIIVNTENKA